MVLAELGQSLTAAISNLTKASEIDETVVNQMLNQISKALLAADVDFPLVVQVQKGIKAKINLNEEGAKHNLKRIIHQAVVNELYKLLDSGTEPYQLKKGKTNVVMFVGLQGAGKTTTVTKYAHYYQRKGWKTGLICADTYRAGAFDQLKQNATKARIPFYGSYTEVDPVVVAEAGVAKFKKEKYDLIIIDTSGRHKQENALFEEMQEVARVTKPDDIVFVMDGSIGKSAKDQAKAFRSAVDVGSVVITKLDGHAKGGGALSAIAATKSPIIFMGTGEQITQFEKFSTKSFVSRLLGMGDIGGLIELVQDADIMDSSQKLVEKLTSDGKFTLRDLSEQFRNIMKLGPLGQLMQMMPNMGLPTGPNTEKDAVSNMKKFLTILDSMNEKELDSDGKPFKTQPSRVARVADGSGTSDEQVTQVLGSYQAMSGLMGGVGNLAKGMGAGGMDMGKMAQSMGLNPQMMQQMQKQMSANPNAMGDMMQQMMGGGSGGPGGGGPGGMDLGSMMSQMMSGGGMQQMMQQMMGGMGGMGGGGPGGGMPGMPPGMGMPGQPGMGRPQGMMTPQQQQQFARAQAEAQKGKKGGKK
jgi:signal recognition particle subunit SRP54